MEHPVNWVMPHCGPHHAAEMCGDLMETIESLQIVD
jgi:hypothetical protein